MEDRALHPDVRRSLLTSIVPFGFVNVVALIVCSVALGFIIGGRVSAPDTRLWVGAVWVGAIAQLVVLLKRRSMMTHSPARWERIYGWVEAYIGASIGAALAIDIVSGEPLTVHMILLCFFMMCTAAAVVAFAGSRLIGRRFLLGLWSTTAVLALVGDAPEVLGVTLLIWPTSSIYLTFATRLMMRSVIEQHRSRELSKDLAIQASTDELTGLLNRRATLQRIQQLIEAGRGGTALFIDLDGFKEVNDRYGHAAGDTVLINVADRLVQVAREDDIVGRLGGDEFIVMLTEPADQHLADVIANRFAGEIARCHGAIHELAVTASVGAARSIDGLTAEDLLGCADTAMYRAKAQGGNVAVHYLESHLD